jgi:hypothetical protein
MVTNHVHIFDPQINHFDHEIKFFYFKEDVLMFV